MTERRHPGATAPQRPISIGHADPRFAPRPPSRRPPSRSPKRTSLGVKLAIVAISLVGVVTAAAVIIALVFPGDIVRDRIVAEVKARTGRDLTIKGPVTFSALPQATVSLHDVTLAAPDGMTAPPLASMQTLEVSVATLPLLWREVVVDSIVVKDPIINLAVDTSGRRSWDILRHSAEVEPPVRLAQAPGTTTSDAPPAATTPSAHRRLPDIALRNVRIENGTLRFADARRAETREATSIAATFDIKSLHHPAKSTGSFVYRGENVDYDMELGSIEPLFQNTPARVALRLSSRPMTASYEGTALFGGNEASGVIEAKAPDTALAATWLGANLPGRVRLGSFDVSGQLRISGKVYAVSNAVLNVNGMQANGSMALDTAPHRPVLRGNLQTAELDVNQMLAPPTDPTASGEATGPRSLAPVDDMRPSDGPATPDNDSEAPATRVQGYTARGGWNENPIRLAALGAVDADIKIGVDRLLYKDLKVGRSRLSLGLRDSVLMAVFDELSLYGGQGKGAVTVDGSVPETPRVALAMTFDHVALRPFLQDAAGLSWIEGNGRVGIDVAGTGANQRAIVENLGGTADLTVAKGAILGVDVNRMAESLGDGDFRNLRSAPGDKTAFSGLAATWAIRDGVATNNDLRVTSDLVRVTGAGTVTLPDRTLDYTIKPRLAGEGGRDGGGGIEVPVHMSGSWEKPKYSADVGGAVEDIGERLKGKNRDEIVDELVGKDSETGKKAKKLLDKLFR